MVTVPSTIACLLVLAAIAVGRLSVALVTAKPMDLVTTHGAADTLAIGMGTDRSVTGLPITDRARVAAVVRVSDVELDDLCLAPRVRLPVIGRLASVRITAGSEVALGEVVLAAAGTRLDGLDLPRTVVGSGAAGLIHERGDLASSGGAAEDDIDVRELSMKSYGLVLRDGIRLSSVRLRPRLGDQSC